jgi:hypothetical protein
VFGDVGMVVRGEPAEQAPARGGRRQPVRAEEVEASGESGAIRGHVIHTHARARFPTDPSISSHSATSYHGRRAVARQH